MISTPVQARAAARTSADVDTLEERSITCFACPRLVAWREQVAVDKRAAFGDEHYWGRPVPGWGDDQPGS